MIGVGTLAAAGLAVWTAAYVGTCAVALWGARAQTTSLDLPASPMPTVLLIRPCTGDEASLEPALRSTAALAGVSGLAVRLTVDDADDPAWPIVRRVAVWLRERGLDARAEVARTQALNRKVGQLAVATRRTRAEVVMVVDADVDLSTFDVRSFLAPLDVPRVGAVWAPPVEVGPVCTFGDRTSAAILGASLHAFTLLGALDPHGLVGKTFAVRTNALRQLGGFEALDRMLGEDMALASRLRRGGWGTRMHCTPVRAVAHQRSMASVLARYTRWLWVIRAQRPHLLSSYPLLLAAAPLLFVAFAVLWPFAPAWAAALPLIALSTRCAVAFAASGPRGRRAAAVGWEWLLADLVLLAAFARVFKTPTVRWRGRMLRLGTGGMLCDAAEAPRPELSPVRPAGT